MRKYLETIKAVDGKIFNIEYHQKRYEEVLKFLNVKSVKKLEDYLNPPNSGLYRCRLIYSANEISVEYHKYQKREISSLKLVYDDNIDYSVKSANRDSLDYLYSLKDEADDILIIKNSLVTDTTIANIAFYTLDEHYSGGRGVWITPRIPLLRGTTRARLLDEGKIFEADIRAEDLSKFTKVALLNAMIDFDKLQNCEFLI